MIAGIDIGTSYSSICVLDESGKIKPVDIATGTSMFGSKYSLPSAVFVEDNGNVLVGQAAMNSRKRRPQNFRMEFKRDLGQDIPIVLGNSSFLPEDFYTELFRHMKASARKMSSESIETVCLTCPAAFGKKKREKVLKAAKAAGFFNVQLVDEPTAAAMSFKEDGVLSGSKKLLIYDFGGGTFDVSLLAYDNGRFSLMTEPSGLERCGGIDIDRMIFEDMQKCIDPEILASIAKDPKKAMRLNVQLSELAVKAKHHLSTASVYEEYIEVGMDDFEYTLTLDKLNTMIAGMVGQTIDVCRKVVEDAGIKVKDLSAILMVGGTSRVPLVQTMVKQMAAGVPVYCSADVDLAVARGALMFAKGEAPQTLKKDETPQTSAKRKTSQTSDNNEDGAAGMKASTPGSLEPENVPESDRPSEKTDLEHIGAKKDFQIGLQYYTGNGLPKSYMKAVEFFTLAAEKGHSEAAWYLGKCWEDGTGVGMDNLVSQQWYDKAQIYAQDWPETARKKNQEEPQKSGKTRTEKGRENRPGNKLKDIFKYRPKNTPDVTALVREFIEKYPGVEKGKDDFRENALYRIRKHLEIPSSEVVLLAHNDTVFGGGKNAYVVTNRGIYSRDLGEPRLFMDWKAFMECKITPLRNNKNSFGGKVFCAHIMGNMGEKMQTFWPELQKYLRQHLK